MADQAPHTLVVMRHAKAEQVGPSDFERPLAARGHRDATAAGRWLAEQGVTPDAALVSAALRTTETWQHVLAGAGWKLGANFDLDLDRSLYSADTDSALDLIRFVDESVSTLVVVGHNPTMAYLAQLLDDGDGDATAMTELLSGTYPTSATAIFAVTSPWAELAPASATLTGYAVGRG
ncbi:MAG: histidine phosphatase family protein [Nocardioides sp.]